MPSRRRKLPTRSPLLAVASIAAACATLAAAPPARADLEAWAWFEQRVALNRAESGGPRIDLRVWTDARFNRRNDGLHQLFVRVGPLVYVTPWMFVGVHGMIQADRLASGRFDQEARAELEPNLFGRIGDFTLNDRNRFEYRWRESGPRTRYRNQLRVNYAPAGARWIPFFWDEVLIDLTGLGLNQNRATIGLGFMLNAFSRIEAGYLFRSRRDAAGWAHDSVTVISLFVDVPKLAP